MASNLQFSQLVSVFDGHNYEFWAARMKTTLMNKELWEIVEEGLPEPPSRSPDMSGADYAKEVGDWRSRKAKDTSALQLIQLAVADVVFDKILSATSAKQAWELLEHSYQGNEKVKMVRLQALRRDFENLKMKEGEKVKPYSERIQAVANQMRALGEGRSNFDLVVKILASMPKSYAPLSSLMEETKDLKTVTFAELVGSLEAHEKKFFPEDEENGEGAFHARFRSLKIRDHGKTSSWKTSYKGKGKKWCGFCKKDNHNEDVCYLKSGRKKPDFNKNKGRSECYNCGKPVHFSKECRSKKPEQAQVSHEQEEAEENHLFTARQDDQESFEENLWLIDSGCTNHMTPNEKVFSRINTNIKVPIRVGNGAVLMTKGKGDVEVMTKKGKRIIRDVFLVPALAKNLLSVPQMIENGYQVTFKERCCIIHDGAGRKVAEVEMVNKSFPIKWSSSTETAMVAKNEVAELWHQRLGHTGYSNLKILQSMNMVLDLPKFVVEKEGCESCILSKHSRDSFPKESETRATKKLELIHSDVCGPMQSLSIIGSRYFLTFIDDATRMVWVYFLKSKSEVFQTFKKFKNLVENQASCKIKKIRSDRGSEYLSGEFTKFLEDHGIERQLTAAYSPQQNGVSERRNRSLVEMARAMIKAKDLPMKFWAEAVHTAAYIQNRIPTKALENKTPLEAWNGTKPSMNHLKVFGCVCYVHIPDEKRKKWDDKSKKAIFVGYSSQTKGYRVYLLEEEKIDISRDVIFDEGSKWDWKQKGVNKQSVVSLEPDCRQEDIRVGDSSSGDDESRGRRSIQPVPFNLDLDSPESSSSQPNRRTRSMSDILLTAPHVDAESAEVCEGCYISFEEPATFEEAVKHTEWRQAMEEEIHMIEKNKTWQLVKRPADKNVVEVKWIFRLKTNAKGDVVKHKARLVAKGFTQQHGVDYLETFAPVSRHETIRLLLAVAAQRKWELFQLDVKSAFLNGKLEEEIYAEQPPGFEEEGKEDYVLRLHKALYGLKQAPRAWYSRIDEFFLREKFKRSDNDHALYTKEAHGKILVVCIYVDDLIVTGDDKNMVEDFKMAMKNEFEMSDLGLLNYFLGMEIVQKEEGIFLSQECYAKKLLEKFNMKECKIMRTPLAPQGKIQDEEEELADSKTYRSLVGGLLYLTATRPDLMFSASYLSRYLKEPKAKHFKEAKRVLRYIKGTTDIGLMYSAVKEPKLVGYSDSDWGGCKEDLKSTTGYCFSIGSAIFSWKTSKQDTIAQSTAEAEYMALCAATNQAIWLRRLLEDLKFNTQEGVPIYCDSQSAIALGKNPVQHRRTKHIQIKYHFVRESVRNGDIKLEYCKSEEQLADTLTKALGGQTFERFRAQLGLRNKKARGSVE